MAVTFKDYYSVLGVSRTASPEEIKKAFRALARQYHPDVAQDKKAAEERFKELNEAHEVLSDPEKRKLYDRLGADWKQGTGPQPPPGRAGRAAADAGPFEFHFGGTGYSDFFEQFFGGAGRVRPGTRGADIEGDILVTLEEVAAGSERVVSLQRVNSRTGENETERLKVTIPPGIEEGQTIRLKGKGEPGWDGAPAGDVYLHVRFAAHPEFRAQGRDLYVDLDVAPWEAVLGTTATVPTLQGRLKVHVPAGKNNGDVLRIRGQGLPGRTGDQRGDMYAVITVQLPPQLSPEERELWERLRRTSTFRARSPE
jgi:curved DNA-binding protein